MKASVSLQCTQELLEILLIVVIGSREQARDSDHIVEADEVLHGPSTDLCPCCIHNNTAICQSAVLHQC